MKRLLIISPYFPPIGGSGVYRMTRIVKYLREFEWEPMVVALANLPGSPQDESLLADLPENLMVRRVRYIEISRRGLQSLLPVHRTNTSPTSNPVCPEEGAQTPQSHVKTYLARVLWNLLLPDKFVTWVPFARQAAKNIMQQCPIHAVLSTSTPNTSHLIGQWCARYAHVPWIADFRDFWSLAAWEQTHHPLFRARSRRMEATVLKKADHILMYSQGMKTAEIAAFQDVPTGKISVLPAAVDLEKFRMADHPSPWQIVYTGNLTSAYPLSFLQAIKEVNQRRQTRGEEPVPCGLAGNLSAEVAALIHAMHDPNIVALGYVPHTQSQVMVKSASVLILSHPLHNSDWWVPGKVVEYLVSGNPIVAIVPPGETADALQEYGHAWMVADDPIHIADAIEQAVQTPRKQEPGVPEIMTARGQAKFVAELVNQLVEQNRHA